MPKFKIFYSWQSDLPGNKTRNFIRDCIDDAIALVEDSEAIEAIRDEATKDTTGSPNIVTTLFSKIDECDLFIADVSLCFTGDVEKEKAGKKIVKHSPNPNVLLELGYAVKTLTWERVICLCNTDFGADFPFDFAQNRRTCYSLEGKTKADVRREVVKTIFRNIQKLKDQVPRAKAGMAAHKIGAYDLEQQIVTGKLVAFEIGKSIPVNHNLCQLQKKEPRGKLRLHLSRMTTTHSKPEVHHELYTEQQDRASVKIHYDHRRGHRQ